MIINLNLKKGKKSVDIICYTEMSKKKKNNNNNKKKIGKTKDEKMRSVNITNKVFISSE